MHIREQLKVANTALVLIEFQKTWTERSFFHQIIKKEYEAKQVFNNTKNLLEIA